MNRLSRRDFLRGLGAVGAAIALEQIVGRQSPTPIKRGIFTPVEPEIESLAKSQTEPPEFDDRVLAYVYSLSTGQLQAIRACEPNCIWVYGVDVDIESMGGLNSA